jgi:hypothetical protein
MGESKLEKLLVQDSSTGSHNPSKRCGLLIDGHFIEPQSGHDKITYECACLDQEVQDIVWGFVLSAEDLEETPPTPKPRDSPPPPVQKIAAPRVKVVMQPQTPPVSQPSVFPMGALLSDGLPAGSSPDHPRSLLNSWKYIPTGFDHFNVGYP